MAQPYSKRLQDLGYKNYAQYLGGVDWKKIKVKFFNSPYVTRVGGVLICSVCRTPETSLSRPLHVHHLTYDNLGWEDMSDLQLVCEDCHAEIHHRPKRKSELKRAYLVINTLKPAPVHLSPEPKPAKFKRVYLDIGGRYSKKRGPWKHRHLLRK